MIFRQNKVRVLLALYPLETHSRGILSVAFMLRGSGMEVILMGNAFPEKIIEVAVQESVDVVGISTYCGDVLEFSKDLLKAAKQKGIERKTIFLLGGVFPPSNALKLKDLGFNGIFGPSTCKEVIIDCIESSLERLSVTSAVR
jgi:methylmalonyl-CoA mutase cobalamin-binding domain/chain